MVKGQLGIVNSELTLLGRFILVSPYCQFTIDN